MQCNNIIRYKNELETKLAYYRNSHYRGRIEAEIRNLDLSTCQQYQDLRHVRIV